MGPKALRATSRKVANELPETSRINFLTEAAQLFSGSLPQLSTHLGQQALLYADAQQALATSLTARTQLCRKCGSPLNRLTCANVHIAWLSYSSSERLSKKLSSSAQGQNNPKRGRTAAASNRARNTVVAVRVCMACQEPSVRPFLSVSLAQKHLAAEGFSDVPVVGSDQQQQAAEYRSRQLQQQQDKQQQQQQQQQISVCKRPCLATPLQRHQQQQGLGEETEGADTQNTSHMSAATDEKQQQHRYQLQPVADKASSDQQLQTAVVFEPSAQQQLLLPEDSIAAQSCRTRLQPDAASRLPIRASYLLGGHDMAEAVVGAQTAAVAQDNAAAVQSITPDAMHVVGGQQQHDDRHSTQQTAAETEVAAVTAVAVDANLYLVDAAVNATDMIDASAALQQQQQLQQDEDEHEQTSALVALQPAAATDLAAVLDTAEDVVGAPLAAEAAGPEMSDMAAVHCDILKPTDEPVTAAETPGIIGAAAAADHADDVTAAEACVVADHAELPAAAAVDGAVGSAGAGFEQLALTASTAAVDQIAAAVVAAAVLLDSAQIVTDDPDHSGQHDGAAVLQQLPSSSLLQASVSPMSPPAGAAAAASSVSSMHQSNVAAAAAAATVPTAASSPPVPVATSGNALHVQVYKGVNLQPELAGDLSTRVAAAEDHDPLAAAATSGSTTIHACEQHTTTIHASEALEQHTVAQVPQDSAAAADEQAVMIKSAAASAGDSPYHAVEDTSAALLKVLSAVLTAETSTDVATMGGSGPAAPTLAAVAAAAAQKGLRGVIGGNRGRKSDTTVPQCWPLAPVLDPSAAAAAEQQQGWAEVEYVHMTSSTAPAAANSDKDAGVDNGALVGEAGEIGDLPATVVNTDKADNACEYVAVATPPSAAAAAVTTAAGNQQLQETVQEAGLTDHISAVAVANISDQAVVPADDVNATGNCDVDQPTAAAAATVAATAAAAAVLHEGSSDSPTASSSGIEADISSGGDSEAAVAAAATAAGSEDKGSRWEQGAPRPTAAAAAAAEGYPAAISTAGRCLPAAAATAAAAAAAVSQSDVDLSTMKGIGDHTVSPPAPGVGGPPLVAGAAASEPPGSPHDSQAIPAAAAAAAVAAADHEDEDDATFSDDVSGVPYEGPWAGGLRPAHVVEYDSETHSQSGSQPECSAGSGVTSGAQLKSDSEAECHSESEFKTNSADTDTDGEKSYNEEGGYEVQEQQYDVDNVEITESEEQKAEESPPLNVSQTAPAPLSTLGKRRVPAAAAQQQQQESLNLLPARPKKKSRKSDSQLEQQVTLDDGQAVSCDSVLLPGAVTSVQQQQQEQQQQQQQQQREGVKRPRQGKHKQLWLRHVCARSHLLWKRAGRRRLRHLVYKR